MYVHCNIIYVGKTKQLIDRQMDNEDLYILYQSVQFSHSVMSDSLWPHGLQHARPPCSSPTPRVYSNSCPLSWWYHPTISSCHPLLLLTSIFPSIRVFSNKSVLCIRWPKYWSFNSSISPSNEYSGLISFRMDWLDLLAVQGTLKSLLQHHSSKAWILNGPRDALTQKKAGFPCNALNAGSYFISQDEAWPNPLWRL